MWFRGVLRCPPFINSSLSASQAVDSSFAVVAVVFVCVCVCVYTRILRENALRMNASEDLYTFKIFHCFNVTVDILEDFILYSQMIEVLPLRG